MNRSELPNELEEAARCVDHQVNAFDLATFAYDVLANWAETHSLTSGQRSLSERAADYGVTHDNAVTELGNLLAILERGPRGNAELGLIAAFAMRGFDSLFVAAHGGEHRAASDRFVAQLDWLELATEYRLTPFIDRLLGVPTRRELIQALSRAIGREDLPSSALPDVGARGRNAARLSVLASLSDETAVDVLRSIRRQARDPATRALALALGPEGSDREETLRVTGIARTPSRSVPIALLRWLSGYALLQAIQRFACFLIVLRRDLELELRGDALQVRSRTSMLGRTLRSTEACYDVLRVTGAFRRARFALLRSVVGVLSLSIGILIGGYLVFDGARGGAPLLLVIGAAVVAVGSSVDLALNVLLPARRARVDVQVDLRGASSLRLGRVPQADADRLLHALSLRLER